MSDSFWESEVMEETRAAKQTEEPAARAVSEPAATPDAAATSANDFSALEERILRAVDLLKRERQARAWAEKRADAAEQRLREQAPLAERLEGEVSALRAERDQVRQRVEKLLSQLDALEM